MKLKTPYITLLTGAALGAVLLVASMLATPKAPASPAAAATPAPASTASRPPSPASPTPAATAVATVPARANYAGEVNGGGASVAISIHGGQAIAYVCNGSVIEAWLKGTAAGGHADHDRQGPGPAQRDLQLQAGGRRTSSPMASATRSRRPRCTSRRACTGRSPIVRGAKIKAGWIVLPDGTPGRLPRGQRRFRGAVGDPGTDA